MVAECLLRHLEGGGCAPRSPRLFFTEKMKISSTFYGDFMGDWVGDFMGFAWDFMVFYGDFVDVIGISWCLIGI